MAFFSKVGESLSSASKSVAEKAKQLAEISSLNGRISTQEEIIEHAYLEIGKRYYEIHKENPDENFEEFCTLIKEALVQINVLKEEIKKVKGIQVCNACGEEVSQVDAFCQKCGNKMSMPVADVEITQEVILVAIPEERVDGKVCQTCGKAQEIGVSFCCDCGTKIE